MATQNFTVDELARLGIVVRGCEWAHLDSGLRLAPAAMAHQVGAFTDDELVAIYVGSAGTDAQMGHMVALQEAAGSCSRSGC